MTLRYRRDKDKWNKYLLKHFRESFSIKEITWPWVFQLKHSNHDMLASSGKNTTELNLVEARMWSGKTTILKPFQAWLRGSKT